MFTRRQVLQRSVFSAATLTTPGLFAEQLRPTAPMTEGPFYPDELPLDTDNDLLVINDSLSPAVGEITHLSGRILSKTGTPLRNAFVEIWQVDQRGVYLHSGDDRKRDQRDTNFQGYGRFLTDSKGRYYFRTIKPVPYVGRTPHIHFGISLGGKRIFTTQLLIQDHPQNKKDGLFRRIQGAEARQTVQTEFKAMPDSKTGELAADFDIVLGRTIEEMEDGTIRGVGQPQWPRRS